MSEQVTLGEVYRLCQRIDAKVDRQNGRVRKLEIKVALLWVPAVAAGALFLGWVKFKLGL